MTGYSLREAERVYQNSLVPLGDDEQACEHCGDVLLAEDLWFNADGEHPHCSKCIAGMWTDYYKLRRMVQQMAGVLAVGGPVARKLAMEGEELLRK